MSTDENVIERQPLMGALPRCTICHRRLRSTPWRFLLIGPLCARKHPEMTKLLRDQYQQKLIDAATDPNHAQTQLETMDAELRRVGAVL